MSTVYLLWHSAESEPYDGPLLLGVYSSLERAEARIEEASAWPGFRDHPTGFEISTYEVDKDQWTQGFVNYEYRLDDESST